tara:strand:+ start:1334 stop:1507 length:174 start_codon:yes stop_codon:yes gene_type:complete
MAIGRTFGRLGKGASLTNRELAVLMGVSKGEASKLVSRHPTLLRRQRTGRHVRITMH